MKREIFLSVDGLGGSRYKSYYISPLNKWYRVFRVAGQWGMQHYREMDFSHQAMPRQASIFNRDRSILVEIGGQDRLLGNHNLQMPMACRILDLEFHSALTSLQEASTLHINLSPLKEAFLRVHLLARNVRDIKTPLIGAEGIDCGEFDILDVQHLGRAFVNWKIGETSQLDHFHFMAEQVEITSVTFEG